MGRAAALGRDRPSALGKFGAPGSAMSSTGTTISRSISCGRRRRRSRTRARADEELAIRSSGAASPRARSAGAARGSRASASWPRPVTRRSSRSKVSARWEPRLRLGDGVDLVDDHRLDAGEDLAHPRGDHQIQRLGGRDQDVGRLSRIAWRSFCGVSPVRGRPRGRRRSRQRRAQVALDVVGERLQRRDVDDLDARPRARAPARACRSPRGRPPASSRSPSGRRSACCRPRRSRSSPLSGRAWAPRRRPRTSA